jgi:hypothetical protein
MKSTSLHLKALVTAAAVAAAAGAAHARNDKLLLPLDTALRGDIAHGPVSQDVALRFGKASAGGETGTLIEVHAVADPYAFNNMPPNSGNARRDRKSDNEVCFDAFRKAVADLQQRARAMGAAAVAGIVSNYEHVEMDSAQVYECHVGSSRAIVDLKGQALRNAPQAARAQQPVALASPVAPGAPAAPAAPLVAPGQVPMIATGFANIADVDAIPYLGDKGRESYRDWLARPTPRAFAISTNGNFAATWTLKPLDASLPTDPSERALHICAQRAQMPCRLYAVNGSVVWTKEAK